MVNPLTDIKLLSCASSAINSNQKISGKITFFPLTFCIHFQQDSFYTSGNGLHMFYTLALESDLFRPRLRLGLLVSG